MQSIILSDVDITHGYNEQEVEVWTRNLRTKERGIQECVAIGKVVIDLSPSIGYTLSRDVEKEMQF